MPHVNPTDDELREILGRVTTIAMVGASAKPERESHGVLRMLLDAGYRVLPVNPRESEILGQRVYASLADLPPGVEIVDVFRRAEETPPIADEAVRIGAEVLWLQLGVVNEQTAARATRGGLRVVMDRCIAQTVRFLGVATPHRRGGASGIVR